MKNASKSFLNALARRRARAPRVVETEPPADLATNMAESFDKWLQGHPLRPMLHSQIVKQVEGMLDTVAKLKAKEGYQQALHDTAEKLHDVADWCRANGFDARARHTDSAARRVLGASPPNSPDRKDP